MSRPFSGWWLFFLAAEGWKFASSQYWGQGPGAAGVMSGGGVVGEQGGACPGQVGVALGREGQFFRSPLGFGFRGPGLGMVGR